MNALSYALLLLTLCVGTRLSTSQDTSTSPPPDDRRPRPPATHSVDCSYVLPGQYACAPPKIDPNTQQPYGCTRDNVAPILCTLNDGLECRNGTGDALDSNATFVRHVPCEWTNGYSFETTMLLSIFLGMFGADRFYLGYYGLGLLKFCTLGMLFFGQLVDIILIAMQIVRPADGSYYVVKYFGPRLSILAGDNETYVPKSEW